MKNNNSGFSLVELMVVVAIMAVLSTGVYIGYNALFNQKAKTAAKEVKAMLQTVRMTTMSKSGTYKLLISEDSTDGCVIIKSISIDSSGAENVIKEEKLDSSISIVAKKTNGSEQNASDGIELSFNRSSGAFEPCNGIAGGEYYNQLIVKGGSTVTILLSQSTGKMSIDY